jgi:hypothetical protein
MQSGNVLLRAFAAILLAATSIVTACQVPTSTAPPAGSPANIFLPEGEVAEGRKAFMDSRCNTCHAVPSENIERRVEGNIGPDLGEAQAAKTRDMLATSIIAPSHAFAGENPEQYKAGGLSRMGDYSRSMTVRQWIDLVTYIKSLSQAKPAAGGSGGPGSNPAIGKTLQAAFAGSVTSQIVQPLAPKSEEEAIALARASANELSASLRDLLTAQLAAGGPKSAIAVCSTKAQPATQALSKDKGVAIRRVSLRWRNPADEPDAYEKRILENFERAHAEKQLPAESIEFVTQGAVRQLRYMRPITVAPMCTACHGQPNEVSPEVQAVLREHYPADTATGYRVGDLRGAFSVTVPLGSGL